MLYSPQRGVLILEVPKTGTVALSTGLRDVCEQVKELPRHVGANQARKHFGKERWNELETVAVVREPVSWLRSWYRYLNGKERLGPDLPFPTFVELIANGELIDGNRINVRSQFYRLSDGRQRRVIVKHLLCFEHLGDEYASLNSEFLGGEGAPLQKANVSPRKKTEVTDELQEQIRDHWSQDFEIWRAAKGRANRKYQAAS